MPEGADGSGGTGLRLLHEDPRLIAVNKPPGLLVHRTALDAHETDSVMCRLRQTGLGPLWPVHRLDKGTSGVLVLARDAKAAQALGAAFEAAAVAKQYLALVRGWPAPEGRVDHPLARDPERPSRGQDTREACTRWQRLATFEWPFSVDGRHASSRYALVLACPHTGRRHQIRRHFKVVGHPLIGDSTHGKGAHNRAVAAWLGASRLWLHALTLTLPHPDDQRPLRLQAAPSADWVRLVEGLDLLSG